VRLEGLGKLKKSTSSGNFRGGGVFTVIHLNFSNLLTLLKSVLFQQLCCLKARLVVMLEAVLQEGFKV
jgi:hypothetical protein